MKNVTCIFCVHYKVCEKCGVFEKENAEQTSCDMFISLLLHQMAVGKMIPKRPKGYFESYPHYKCPACGSSVKDTNDSDEMPCCAYCGQRLWWESDDEGDIESEETEV